MAVAALFGARGRFFEAVGGTESSLRAGREFASVEEVTEVKSSRSMVVWLEVGPPVSGGVWGRLVFGSDAEPSAPAPNCDF